MLHVRLKCKVYVIYLNMHVERMSLIETLILLLFLLINVCQACTIISSRCKLSWYFRMLLEDDRKQLLWTHRQDKSVNWLSYKKTFFMKIDRSFLFTKKSQMCHARNKLKFALIRSIRLRMVRYTPSQTYKHNCSLCEIMLFTLRPM